LVVHGETPSKNKDSRLKIGKIWRIISIYLLVYSLFTMYIVILYYENKYIRDDRGYIFVRYRDIKTKRVN
jgi:hypothetical protein